METEAIEHLIAAHGYWALFVGTFLEGETFFLLGGIAARNGLLDPWYVALAAGSGGFIGDQLFFFLGMWRGEAIINRFARLRHRAKKARRLVRRHATALVLLSRFLYGFRTIVPLVCGASGIRPLVFVGLNLFSAMLWTLAFGGLGYLFGGWISGNLDLVKNLQMIAGLVIGILLATMILGRIIQRRLMKQAGPDSKRR